MPTVFVTSTMHTSFIRDDIDMLRKHYTVNSFIGSGLKALGTNFFQAMKADLSFCWFGSVYSFFVVMGARLGGKKSIIMLGGVDVAREPDLKYGIWLSPWKSFLLKIALKKANRVFAVDASLRNDVQRVSGWGAKEVDILPTGYDSNFWKPGNTKEPFVLCVAPCNSMQRIKIKGIDLLLQAAQQMPDTQFVVVGIQPHLVEQLENTHLSNVQLLPPVPREELLEYYQRAKVYCQPSRREGLPNALCEAMLCECIPVGAEVGGVPTAIDRYGETFEKENVDALCTALEQAMSDTTLRGEEGRRHIAEMFPKERRERRLTEEINRLLHA